MALVFQKLGPPLNTVITTLSSRSSVRRAAHMLVASPMMGSFGCCALEYHRSGHATVKSDVYSFWVVLV